MKDMHSQHEDVGIFGHMQMHMLFPSDGWQKSLLREGIYLGNLFQKINITVNVDLIPNLKTMIGFIYDWPCL